MILDNIDKDELVTIKVEDVHDVEKWKPLMFEMANGDEDTFVSVNEERLVGNDDSINKQGSNTIEIICSVGKFIELVPQLRKLDELDMLSVGRTYQELENYYYDEE